MGIECRGIGEWLGDGCQSPRRAVRKLFPTQLAARTVHVPEIRPVEQVERLDDELDTLAVSQRELSFQGSSQGLYLKLL